MTSNLHATAMRGKKEDLAAVLDRDKHGRYINEKDANGYTALFHAVQNVPCFELLLERKVDANMQAPDDSTVAHKIAEKNCGEAAVLLCAHMPNSSLLLVANKKGMNALHVAAKNGHLEVLRPFVEYWKKDVDAGDKDYNWSPLCLAAKFGFVDSVLFLLQAGANVNFKAARNVTPLMFAAKSGHLETVECLLKHGADAWAKDDEGHTALDFAKEKAAANVKVIEHLEAFMAD